MPCVNWSEKNVKGIREVGFGEMVHETCSIEKDYILDFNEFELCKKRISMSIKFSKINNTNCSFLMNL